MPKIDREQAVLRERLAYPGSRLERTRGCFKTMLSDAGSLTQFGAGEVELKPGAASSLMHWHEQEDEFVYVLQGEVVLVEQHGGETVMHAGDCAAFPAGTANGHTFENRSAAPVRLLEVGSRAQGERAHYPGVDMVYHRSAEGSHFTTRGGEPLGREDEPDAVSD
ncbi:MAG: cupin domain-containing protein [Pseudomonadota bacterium]